MIPRKEHSLSPAERAAIARLQEISGWWRSLLMAGWTTGRWGVLVKPEDRVVLEALGLRISDGALRRAAQNKRLFPSRYQEVER